jgi:LysR family glycine cleavage system transcriptional activator
VPVAPPRPKGPPLNALRAFEAAARLGSFSAAAEELFVTAGAIAQHVKSLEEWAGAPLFERRAQGVRLTGAGAAVLPEFTAAFDRMGEAVRALKSQAAPQRLNIAALPSIAQLWLSPRLPAIRAALPEVSISVTAMEQPPNAKRELFDLSLFYLPEEEAGDGIVLARDVIFPVATPEIAAKLAGPEDLETFSCLEDVTWQADWALWQESAGVTGIGIRRGRAFSLYALAVEEARNGAGIVMGHEALVRSDLETGRLKAPFDLKVETGLVLVLTSTMPTGRNRYVDGVAALLGESTKVTA